MEAEGISPSAIRAFESTFKMLASGETGIIKESSISPVPDLDKAAELDIQADTTLLGKTVVLKLNGGLGTGMGLDKAKSLLKGEYLVSCRRIKVQVRRFRFVESHILPLLTTIKCSQE